MTFDFMSYEGEIYGFIKQMIGDGETARDICQDVFIKAVEFQRKMETSSTAINWRAWLYRVAKNMSLNYLKFRRIRYNHLDVDTTDISSSTPRKDVETQILIANVLAVLPHRQQRVIELRDVQGFSYTRIAEIMGLSESAVTSLLSRARENFRREYLLAVAPEWAGTLTKNTGYTDLLSRIDPLNPQHNLKADIRTHVQRYFIENHAQWDILREQLVAPEFIDWLISQLSLHPQMDVLDVGTGTGHCALALAKYVKTVIAIDHTPQMIAKAKEKCQLQKHSNIIFKEGDFENLPLSSAVVDGVVCSLALHHAADPTQVIKECHRVLKKNGILIVCDFLRHNQRSLWEVMRNVWLGFDPEDVKKWFIQAGFGQLQINTTRNYIQPTIKKYRLSGAFCVLGRKYG